MNRRVYPCICPPPPVTATELTHIAPKNVAYLHRKTGAKSAVIPGGLTGTVQYLDVHAFAPFKAAFHTHLEGLKDKARLEIKKSTAEGFRQDCRFTERWYREAMCTSVGAVWGKSVESVRGEVVAQRLRDMGYVLKVSGEEDGFVKSSLCPDLTFAPSTETSPEAGGADLEPGLDGKAKESTEKQSTQKKVVSQPTQQTSILAWAKPVRVNSLTQTQPSQSSQSSEKKRAASPTTQTPNKHRRLCKGCRKPGHNMQTCPSKPKKK